MRSAPPPTPSDERSRSIRLLTSYLITNKRDSTLLGAFLFLLLHLFCNFVITGVQQRKQFDQAQVNDKFNISRRHANFSSRLRVFVKILPNYEWMPSNSRPWPSWWPHLFVDRIRSSRIQSKTFVVDCPFLKAEMLGSNKDCSSIFPFKNHIMWHRPSVKRTFFFLFFLFLSLFLFLFFFFLLLLLSLLLLLLLI